MTILDGSLSQRTDILALQLETDARYWDCGPGGAYRADRTLGNTERGSQNIFGTRLLVLSQDLDR